jgi:hypothetical protein
MTGVPKPKARLQLWHAVRTTGGSRHLVGFVFDHRTLEDGHRIVTSDLVRVRMVTDQRVEVETLNTAYSLGDVDRNELPDHCREALDEILGPGWRPARLGDQ